MADAIQAREHAAKLNPIISSVNAKDTLSQCATLVQLLGVFVATTDHDDSFSCLHLLTGSISAALHFELEAAHV